MGESEMIMQDSPIQETETMNPVEIDSSIREPIIRMEDIVKKYYVGKPNELEILHGIGLKVYEGEFVSIVGESGSGKSTLSRIIKKIIDPFFFRQAFGTIRFGGEMYLTDMNGFHSKVLLM